MKPSSKAINLQLKHDHIQDGAIQIMLFLSILNREFYFGIVRKQVKSVLVALFEVEPFFFK